MENKKGKARVGRRSIALIGATALVFVVMILNQLNLNGPDAAMISVYICLSCLVGEVAMAILAHLVELEKL